MYQSEIYIRPNNISANNLFNRFDAGGRWTMSLEDNSDRVDFICRFIDFEDAEYVTMRLIQKLSRYGIPKRKIVQIIQDWS